MPKILIADDNESLRHALRDVLSRHEGWTVCAEATNGRSAVTLAAETKPDLIILDFLMPLLNGLAAAGEILAATPSVPVVLYTMHMSGQLDREAKRVGVTRVISKTEPFADFVASIEAILSGLAPPIGPLGVSSDLSVSVTPPGDLDLTGPTQSKPPKKPEDTTQS
jgi:DNA-binding NarL/FixJ family response regulator